MLLALCHRCWTWMEPKHERCVECGGTINLDTPDPSTEQLLSLLGASLGLVGEVSWKRPRLPSFGTLSLFEHGLLFLPDLRELPSGALAAVEGNSGGWRGEARSGFWSLFSRRTLAVPTAPRPCVRPLLSEDAAVGRFLNSPGALFVRRETIVRIVQRGTLLRIERKPGRTVAMRIESGRSTVQEGFRKLTNRADWTAVPIVLMD